MTQAAPSGQQYALGHSEDELGRLVDQSQTLNGLTLRVLHLAGLGPGMRVLDIGCGAGDVAFLAARIVGPEGHVIGVDRSAEAIGAARRRAATDELTNVEFRVADLPDLELEEAVDALIGRLVLMYFTDPAVALRRLSPLVRPGGIVAFHELDTDGAKSDPPGELFSTSIRRIAETFVRTGADVHAGLRLGATFREAGLPSPQLTLGANIECGPDYAFQHQVAGLTRSLLPLMERTGVATAAEVEIDTLAERLQREMIETGATVVSPSYIGAWTRTGG
jgi:SAM-dependent methyltransferase